MSKSQLVPLQQLCRWGFHTQNLVRKSPHLRITRCSEQTLHLNKIYYLAGGLPVHAPQQPPAADLLFSPFLQLITPRQQPEQARTPPGFLSCPELFAVFPRAGEERRSDQVARSCEEVWLLLSHRINERGAAGTAGCDVTTAAASSAVCVRVCAHAELVIRQFYTLQPL